MTAAMAPKSRSGHVIPLLYGIYRNILVSGLCSCQRILAYAKSKDEQSLQAAEEDSSPHDRQRRPRHSVVTIFQNH